MAVSSVRRTCLTPGTSSIISVGTHAVPVSARTRRIRTWNGDIWWSRASIHRGSTSSIGFRDLTVWSFLMASAHGAGLMVLPFVMPAPAAQPAAGREHAAHMASMHTTVAAADGVAVAIHTLAYLVVMALAAWVVYRKLGLRLLRTAWLNMDWLWAGALFVTGVVVLLK